MKTVSKVLPLILITSMVCYGQKKILSKVLTTNSSTVLNMDFKKVRVEILKSSDQNIYIDFEMDFKNYPKNEETAILEGIDTDIATYGNTYTFRIDSEQPIKKRAYSIDSPFGISIDDLMNSGEQPKRKYRKSEAELIEMIDKNDDSDAFLKSLKTYNADGSEEPVDLESLKSYGATIIVKVPETIPLSFNLYESNLIFKYDAQNSIRCQGEDSSVRGGRFANEGSIFRLNNGSFDALEVNGGRFRLKDLSTILIGSLRNVVIDSEFSTFKIGLLRSNVKIRDFNSTFWLYNFDKNIGELLIDSEYSKINLFLPQDKKNYVITTYGYGTVHYINGNKMEVRPSRSKESTTMVVVGSKGSTTTNRIKFNTINGIIRMGDDFIEELN